MNLKYRKTIIAGNWKMHLNAQEAKEFITRLKPMAAQEKALFIDVGILLGVSALMLLFAFTKKKTSRPRRAPNRGRAAIGYWSRY